MAVWRYQTPAQFFFFTLHDKSDRRPEDKKLYFLFWLCNHIDEIHESAGPPSTI